MNMNISRRSLLTGTTAATALTALAPGLRVSFAADAATTTDVLIVLFQRGACDWLQMLAPAGDANYIAARPTIRVPTTGDNAGLGLGSLGGTDFYLSASAPELKTLYDTGNIAFVHAVGIHTEDRSHFTCQDMMEKGWADLENKQNTGWLARHIASANGVEPDLATIASGPATPPSLLGEAGAVSISDVSNFNITGGASNTSVIRAINSGTTAYKKGAVKALDAIDDVQNGLKTLTDTSATAGYTNGQMSQALRSLAKMIKMDVGVRTATVDFGGWDMHNNLVNEFAQRTTEFSKALAAFWKDMEGYHHRITLVTMTEFGRRLQENANRGTDHGAASGMLIMGGNVKGNKLYGTWPGLAANQTTNGDLAVTTDYRQVLAEIIVTRHGEKNLATVFPTITYKPIGFMKA
jgi:uncharacterized protein (DUF1501 family)